jgi:uncharacterized membrane protein YqjE
MLHSLISTLIQRPDLVVDHVTAYAALFQEEASNASKDLLAKALAWTVAAVSALVFMGLAGTAIMLGVMHDRFHWALVAVPGITLLISIVAVLFAQKPPKGARFVEFRAQLDSDAQALRMAA